MQKCTTAAATPQPRKFPKVSYRLLVVATVRMDAQRHGINPQPAIAAAHRAWNATHDRFAARRAGWAAVDAQCGRKEVG